MNVKLFFQEFSAQMNPQGKIQIFFFNSEVVSSFSIYFQQLTGPLWTKIPYKRGAVHSFISYLNKYI